MNSLIQVGFVTQFEQKFYNSEWARKKVRKKLDEQSEQRIFEKKPNFLNQVKQMLGQIIHSLSFKMIYIVSSERGGGITPL